MKKLLMIALAVMAFSACNKGDDAPKSIEITGGEKNQTVYADETEGAGGIQFTAKETWTADVKESPATRANAVEWLRPLFNGEEKYEGAAGSFTLTVELDENYTGQPRTATITIASGSDKIGITVTQGAKTANGVVPKLALVARIVSTDNDGWSSTSDFFYDAQNRLIKIESSATEEGDEWDTQEVVATFKYAPGSLVIEEKIEFSNGAVETNTYSYTLGSSGYATSGTMAYTWSSSQGNSNSTSNDHWTGTYDAAGYLTRSQFDDFVYNITWSGGNMTKLASPGEGETVIEYGNVVNSTKCNIDLNYLASGDDFIGSPLVGMLRIIGKPSAKMMSKQTETVYPNSVGTVTYTYETNAAGLITKITTVEKYGSETDTVVSSITYR